jgi:hypothetical protein
MQITVRNLLAFLFIISGILIVFFDILNTYYYFTAQKEFPQVFAAPKGTVSSLNEAPTTPTDITGALENQIGNIVKDQIQGLLPENSVSQLLNMSSWMLFASFLLWAGGRLIGLGAGFLKEGQ